MVKEIKTKSEFDQELATAGKLVVVDFTASWCPPCQMIKPIFQKMSEDNPDVLFLKVDVDENSETSEAQGVEAMPTFMFFKDGNKIHTITGADKAGLEESIKKYK